MYYKLHAVMHGSSEYYDEYFVVNKHEFKYDDVIDVVMARKGSKLTDGILRIKLTQNRSLDAWYNYKELDDAYDVYEFLQDVAAENRKYYESQRKRRAKTDGPFATAESTYKFCQRNRLGYGFNEKWGVKHFQVLINHLADDERILLPFIGLHNYISATKHDGYFAYAITNKRIVMAQQKVIGEAFQAVSLENVNDITLSTGVINGLITVDTYKEKFNINVDPGTAKNIHVELHKVLDKYRASRAGSENRQGSSSNSDSISYLRELKALVDDGIITQEEFDAKKREILGL